MANNKGETVKKVAIGAAISAVVGYIAGILTAPKSGKETRADIKDKAVESYQAAEKELKKLHTELSDVIAEAGDRLKNLKDSKQVQGTIDKAEDARTKVREVLSALHDGESDDKELQKAINEATNAIQNLKDYLKK